MCKVRFMFLFCFFLFVSRSAGVIGPVRTSKRVLTDGTLLWEPGDRSVLLVPYWTREAICNARHSRPRPPSHIRNLLEKMESRDRVAALLAVSSFVVDRATFLFLFSIFKLKLA